MLNNSSGPFSRKTPKQTNPALFSLPDRQPFDQWMNAKLSSEEIAKGNLNNIWSSNETDFRNQPYDLDWRTYQDLAEHANWHVEHNTFGGGEEGYRKLFIHQELMYEGMMAGMSFLEGHQYALKRGPQPVHNSSHP